MEITINYTDGEIVTEEVDDLQAVVDYIQREVIDKKEPVESIMITT